MTLNELQKLVSLGEGLHLEFKQRIPEPQRIAKEVIALANTAGGKVVVGVSDDGKIMGVKDADEELFAFEEALQHFCTPAINLKFEVLPLSARRDVLIIHVPNSKDKPHFLIESDQKQVAYLRVEDKSIEASREARRLMRFEQNESDVWFEFGEKERVLMEYLERYEKITIEQFSRIAHIPKRSAAQTLYLLCKAKILHLYPQEQEDLYGIKT
jgi:predicted HTH transcriptional regulator